MEKRAIYCYNLSHLDNVSKVRFVYTLKGRKGGNGIVKELGGSFLVPGCFIIPLSSSESIEEVFRFWNVKFRRFEVYDKKEGIDYVY